MSLPIQIRAIGRGLLITLSLCFATGPLAVLQIGAWGWMLASYSQESSFSQAIEETFSGERPCSMCKLIIEVEETEREQQPASTSTSDRDLKLMLVLGQAVQLPQPLVTHTIHNTAVSSLESVSASVPTPPPRLV